MCFSLDTKFGLGGRHRFPTSKTKVWYSDPLDATPLLIMIRHSRISLYASTLKA
jgi:hypothetical protein